MKAKRPFWVRVKGFVGRLFNRSANRKTQLLFDAEYARMSHLDGGARTYAALSAMMCKASKQMRDTIHSNGKDERLP